MSLLSKTEKDRARTVCRRRNKHTIGKCGVCGRPEPEYIDEKKRQMDLDHIDGDPDNNPPDGSNWQLACHSCNVKKNPRGKRKQPYFNGIERLKEYQSRREAMREDNLPIPATMQKNREAEPLFRKSVERLITRYGKMARGDVVDAASEAAGVSQATGTRYLDKMCSLLGGFRYTKDQETKILYVERRDDEQA